MKILSIEAFVPSWSDFAKAKQLFQELGFHINWESPGYAGFQCDECRFILQDYNVPDFAQNFMLSIKVNDINEFRKGILDKELPQKYGVRISEIKKQPYGLELNLIDIAGVCWHFVQQ